jgi:serine/threonine protein kinase
MWSVGVVLYVMLCGYTPFSEESQEKMFERIKLGDWKFDVEDWSHVSEEAKDLIKHLMDTNVDHRYTAEKALKSKWITGLTDQQLSSRNLSSTVQVLKDRKPLLKDIGLFFAAMKITAHKAKGGLSTVASTAASAASALKGMSTPNISNGSLSNSSGHDLV